MMRWPIVLILVAAQASSPQAAPLDLTVPASSVVDAGVAPPARRRHYPHSYLLPAIETVGLNVIFHLTSRLADQHYAQTTPSSVWNNMTGAWEWDVDDFSTNQVRHPLMGALFFTSARSTGLGFWTSAIYAFMGSLLWEIAMEIERPSFNDQITTPVGGVALGEIMHRYGQRVLWNHGREPELPRRIFGSLVDPMGALNELAWARREPTLPPPSFGYLAIGPGLVDSQFDVDRQPLEHFYKNQLHIGASLTYGNPGDPFYVPRRPMDHFDLQANLELSTDDIFGSLYIRGLLVGRAFRLGRARGFWGLYNSYDFVNPYQLRVGAIGFGLGATAQLRLGKRGFLQGTLLQSVVPFGAAGGGSHDTPIVGFRDYHWGPGLLQLAELKVGRANLGSLTFSSRTYEIKGYVFDEGNEVVALGRFAALLHIKGRHGVGFEALGTVRRASFEDGSLDTTDTGAQLGLFYTLLSGSDYGLVLD